MTLDEGLLRSLAIPLTLRQAVSTYQAQIVLIPQPELRIAILSVIEEPYLAISDQMEYVTPTGDHFEECQGSARYQICRGTSATQTNRLSCLATLFVSSTLKAA